MLHVKRLAYMHEILQHVIDLSFHATPVRGRHAVAQRTQRRRCFHDAIDRLQCRGRHTHLSSMSLDHQQAPGPLSG